MLYSKNKNLDDYIIELLVRGSQTVKSIHKVISQKIPQAVTLRAVYKSVNKLIDAHVLLKVEKEILVNREWIYDIKFGLSDEKRLPFLNKNEKVIYTLFSMSHIDTYWKTITSQIGEESKYPVFFYNPHDFWIYVPERRESENSYYRSFTKTKRHAFFTIGDISHADKIFKKRYQSDYLQIDLSQNTSFSRTRHITIVGDYIITVILTTTSAKDIDALYDQDISEEVMVHKIKKIIQRPQKLKIIIENKPDKAKKIRKRLIKNFYIPLHLKKEYKLF